MRPCSQMLVPPQSLQVFPMRLCSQMQMLAPLQFLHLLLLGLFADAGAPAVLALHLLGPSPLSIVHALSSIAPPLAPRRFSTFPPSPTWCSTMIPRVWGVCFITAGPITKLFAWGGEESGGQVLRETTSRGLCGLVSHVGRFSNPVATVSF
jgi:hypothetical protein